ncbi:MAG: hypothetical protein HGA51_09765 [Demequinaceae bacterium]|nr:hypothetical protein [Demequinaceae bacterium]
MSVVGGTVFGYMFDVLAWGIVLSLFAIALAFFAEGRGSHAIRVLLGTKPRKDGLDVFATLQRDEGDWQVVGRLADTDREPSERAGLERVGGTRV